MSSVRMLAGALALALMSAAPSRAQIALEWAAQGMGRPPLPLPPARSPAPRGGRLVVASWYGGGERLNRHTASGEIFRPQGFTAAHRTLPRGTRLAVTYAGRTIVVRVNDRGPAAWTGRSLDLSRGAAAALGFLAQGEAAVRMAVIGG